MLILLRFSCSTDINDDSAGVGGPGEFSALRNFPFMSVHSCVRLFISLFFHTATSCELYVRSLLIVYCAYVEHTIGRPSLVRF